MNFDVSPFIAEDPVLGLKLVLPTQLKKLVSHPEWTEVARSLPNTVFKHYAVCELLCANIYTYCVRVIKKQCVCVCQDSVWTDNKTVMTDVEHE